MLSEEVEIVPITLEELRADVSGILIRQMAVLAYRAFRQPPWRDEMELPRLHFGLGVDIMRRGALALVAKRHTSASLLGYVLGYEVFRSSDDPRDVIMAELAGTHALDELFDNSGRVFYVDTLCVDPGRQGQGIGYQLSSTLIDVLRERGFRYRVGRTSLSAEGMRQLYQKLGFEELPVHDAAHPDLTYWLLCL